MSSRRTRTPFKPYALAVLCVFVATVLTQLLQPFLGSASFALFYAAVAVSSWYGGIKPGLLAIALSSIAISYLFLAPIHSIKVAAPGDLLRLGVTALVMLLIAYLTAELRRAKQRIEQLSKQQLHESEAQLSLVLQAARMGMWDWNILTGEINWSPEHERLFGLAPGTFDGRHETFDACLHPDDREALSIAVNRAIQKRSAYQHEYRVIWADGSIHWIEGRGQAFYDETAQAVRMTGTVMDINDRKLAQAALQEREAILRLFAQNAPAGIAMLDRDMHYIMASQRWVDEYNLGSIESLMNHSHYEVFPEVPQRWREIHQRCLAGAQEKCDEDLFVRADGTQQWISWEIRPWYTATDEIGGIVIFSIDVTKHKQTEAALRESQIQLQRQLSEIESIYQSAPIGLSVLDTELRFVRINQRLAEINGLPVEVHIGRTVSEVVPNLADTSEQLLRSILETGEPVLNVEIIGETSAQPGVQRTWLESWLPLKDGDRMIGISVVCEEITRRKLAEQTLAKELLRIQTVFDTSFDGIVIIDGQGNVLDANPRFAEMLGYTPEETAKLSVFDWDAQFTHEELQQLMRDYISFKSGVLETRHRRQDGSIYDVEISVSVLEWEGEILRFCACRDISDRKQAEAALIRAKEELETRVQERTAELSQANAQLEQELIERQRVEEALRQSEEKFRQLAENIEDVFWMSDFKHQQLIYVSPAYEAVWGTPREDAYRDLSQFYKAIHPEDFQRVERAFLEKVFQGLYDEEYRIIRPDGSIRWIRDRAFPVKSESGELMRVAGISQDISDRKLAESALQQAKVAAEAANQAKSIFLANMSHELRTPLNAILGFSQLMYHDTNLSPEQQENLRLITRSGEHLLTLINQILDLAKIEAGRTTLNETAFDLIRLLDDLEDMFQLKAQEKGLHLICDRPTTFGIPSGGRSTTGNRCDDVPQYVRGDEVKLRQVLMNLLSNAIKFTKEGGVSLRVARRQLNGVCTPSSQAEQPTSEQGQLTLYFEIEDTGPGIAPDELDKLFQAFVQTQTGFESQQGTGLGLIISQQFVKLMGGEITVSSTVGRGTIFKFDIHLDVADATAVKTKPPTRRILALQPNQPRYRLLIVDDRWDNRQLLIKLLNPLGFEIKEATNGIEAIERWSNWEPHLIFMDMQMPVMDGYEATKQIKTTTQGQATAIVALSASNFEEARAVVFSVGCDDFIHKPFREADIFDALHKHIGVRYVYDEPPIEPNSIPTQALAPEAIAALPADWLASLQKAAIEGDLDLILIPIEQIRSQNEALANALASLAKKFQFKQLLTLIQPQPN